MYNLICLIIPTADALKVLSSRASSKRMMKVYFLSLTLTFRFLSRVSRSRDSALTYWAHNPLNSRGVNGKRTEHQNGGGGPYL